jgi:peptidoglycan/xylan/chitin deacetylase (PgdA/CDA1 family)
MPAFREQINRLIDQGYKFIHFQDCLNVNYLTHGTWFCVTFDDGHKSNLAALEFLHSKGIVPAAFVVSEWSLGNAGFLSAEELLNLSAICDFGAHGATHTGLTMLSGPDLLNELEGSKHYLEAALGHSIELMALPGGRFNDSVLAAAKSKGFKFIGNSIPLRNTFIAPSINRVTIHNTTTVGEVSRLGSAGAFFWAAQGLKIELGKTTVRLVGEQQYTAISTQFKRILRMRV